MKLCIKTVFVALCLTLFHISHAQILPDSGNMGGGDSFTKLTPEIIENTDIGHIRAMACGASFTRYSICLKWNSLDIKKSPTCFKVNEAALNLSLLSLKETKKMAWATAPILNPDVSKYYQSKQLGFLSYADEEPKDWGGQDGWYTGFSQVTNSTSQYAGKFRRGAQTVSITCPEDKQPQKHVGDSLNYLGEFKPPSINQGLEECLLAERKLATDGTTYWYDRSRFICLPTDAEAERQLAHYVDALTQYDGFKHLKKRQERNSGRIYLTFDKEKISSSEICQTQITAQVINPNDIDKFYTDMDYEPEMAVDKAILVYVVREKDCTSSD